MKNEFALTNKQQLTKTIWAFHFNGDGFPSWTPGQYLEWVLPHSNPDKRGIRRFFTISTSSTEKELMLVTRIIDKSSSFKATLRGLNVGDPITARGLDGDFVLPKDTQEKLLFIAGGIGITPFRSMIKYLLDLSEKRDIILLYANKTADDVAFVDLLRQAEKIGVKTIFFFTNNLDHLHTPEFIPSKDGKVMRSVSGYIDEIAIKKYVPDWQERTFYASGPEPMVEAMEKMLKAMGIKGRQLKTDFFPGYNETYQNGN